MKEMKEILKEYNTDAENYLLGFISDDEDFNTLKEYEKSVSSLDDQYYNRIYDLAIYNLTNELLQKIK
jgi:hypothetical protein|tara:strand:- start:536 stop:739 length:204 start_codon:yes stop_codon:yes gene_type:complete